MGAKVIFEPQIQLYKLMHNLEGVSLLVKPGEIIPQYDFHCPLMSLPYAFQTTLDSIPNEMPYITPSEDKRKFWKERLSKIDGPKIGLVWSGGFRPNQPELWGVNNRRNINFEELSKIQLPGVNFISLQKGEGAEKELALLRKKYWVTNNFYEFGIEISDFSDTAGLISQLDLVISVDTSTAHLAGAMNKPVWILNRYDSCWRWLYEAEQSLWYPSARIYTQKLFNDWTSVVNLVQSDLRKFTNN
jgi:hypothetical protein